MNIKPYLLPVCLFVLLGTASPQARYAVADNETSVSYPFSTNAVHFTCWNGGKYIPFTIKGMNLSVSVPGTYPGELAAPRELYAKWLNEIRDAGYNTIRTYTLHYPHFYEVLDSFNTANPTHPLYLMQGIWLEEEEGQFANNLFNISALFSKEIKDNIDCIHGKKVIAQRFGKAYGTFKTDVSKWVLAWIIGREVAPIEILNTNKLYPSLNTYSGSYLSINNVQASEVFITQKLDTLLQYEQEHYNTQRPVSFSSWPTLDPLTHPSEKINFTDEDTACIDLASIDYHKAKAGFFISYHAYPYYPDFVSRDSLYQNNFDEQGQNSYIGYLRDLKKHYGDIPLLIAEFGVPSSWGVAHYSQSGMNHGGFDELNQGKTNIRLMNNIVDAGCAGAVQFAWIDEWFKNTWICDPFDFPVDNRIMWHNIASSEQNFGMLGFKRNDFAWQHWQSFQNKCPLKSIDAGVDYDFFRIQLALNQTYNTLDTMWIALDTYARELGETILPTGDTLSNGAEFLLRICNDNADLFVTQAYDLFGIWHHTSQDSQLYHSTASKGKPWYPVRWKNNSKEQEIQYIGHLQVNRLNLPPSSKDAVIFKNNPADTMEIRLPWTLLQFINPGYRKVMHDNRNTTTITEDTISDGIMLNIKYKNKLLNTTTAYSWPVWNNFTNTVTYHKDGFEYVKDHLKTIQGMYVATEDKYEIKMNIRNYIDMDSGLLHNDLLLENDSATAVIVSPPNHGFISLNTDGSFLYIPETDYAGCDSFTYRVTNDYHSTQATKVSLHIEESYSRVGLLKLYPNPGNKQLHIQSAGNINEVKLYTEKGEAIYSRSCNAKIVDIDVSEYGAGQYFVSIKVGDDKLIEKFVISR